MAIPALLKKDNIMKYHKSSINSAEPTVVMFINGFRCRVSVNVKYDDHTAMPISAKVEIKPTHEQLTKSSAREEYYKFGGWPEFVQFPVEPASEDGMPYTFICTINNSWGDSGNANIFALISNNIHSVVDPISGDNLGFINMLEVDDVYVEASCC